MPNHTCCVPGCSNRHSRTKEAGVRYYKFPADLTLRRVWQLRISRERTFVVTANTRVCSQHFVGGIKDENNPAPTLFPWKQPENETPKRPPPKERIIREPMQPRTNTDQQRIPSSQLTPTCSSQQTPAGRNQQTPTWSSQLTPTCSSQQTPAGRNQQTPTWSSQLTPTMSSQLTPTCSSQQTPSSQLTHSRLTKLESVAVQCCPELKEVAVQTEGDRTFVYALLERIGQLESQNALLRSQLINQTFCIERFSDCDQDIAYYTGFPSYDTLMTFWQYLGEKVDHLNLWRGGRETNITGEVTRGCRKQQLEALSPLHKQGWFFTRGYFTGGVTRRNVCNGRVFPIECNTFEVRCCPPRYDLRSNNQTSAYV